MKKSMKNTAWATLSVALLVGVLFFAIQAADAGPTKYIVEWYNYTCYDMNYNICAGPFVAMKVTPKESWWHKNFDEHPHGHTYVYKKKDDVVQVVTGCSECDFG